MAEIKARTIHKHETQADWEKSSFMPKPAEIVVYDIDETHSEPRFKIGDGKRTVNELPFATGTIAENGAAVFGDEANKALTTNAFAAGEENIAGSYGFVIQRCYRETGATAGIYTLDSSEGLEVGDIYSVVVGGNYEDEGTITAINGNEVTVDPIHIFDPSISKDGFTLNTTYTPYFRIIRKPLVGTTLLGTGAFVSGGLNVAEMVYSTAEGYGNFAGGKYSHVEGRENVTGYAAHAEGWGNVATGHMAHAEGEKNIIHGWQGHGEGSENEITRDSKNGHVEGYKNKVTSMQGHAEGRENVLDGENGHIEGYMNTASGINAHVEGEENISGGRNAHFEGYGNKGKGKNEHLEGTSNKTWKPEETIKVIQMTAGFDVLPSDTTGINVSFSGNALPLGEYIVVDSRGKEICKIKINSSFEMFEGEFYNTFEIIENTTSITDVTTLIYQYVIYDKGNKEIIISNETVGGDNNHLEGEGNTTFGHHNHLEGSNNSTPSGTSNSHIEGQNNTLSGDTNHAEGKLNIVNGIGNHVEGMHNTVGKDNSSIHIEGYGNTVSGNANSAHIEGGNNNLSGINGHVEGSGNKVTAARAHAEGGSTTASGVASHTEGEWTTASGAKSHAGGFASVASGENSFAHGGRYGSTPNKATGLNSVAMGEGAQATAEGAIALGLNTRATIAGQTSVGQHNMEDTNAVFIVGNGEASNWKNAFTVNKDGSATIQTMGNLTNSVATKGYVDNKFNSIEIPEVNITELNGNNGSFIGFDEEGNIQILGGIDPYSSNSDSTHNILFKAAPINAQDPIISVDIKTDAFVVNAWNGAPSFIVAPIGGHIRDDYTAFFKFCNPYGRSPAAGSIYFDGLELRDIGYAEYEDGGYMLKYWYTGNVLPDSYFGCGTTAPTFAVHEGPKYYFQYNANTEGDYAEVTKIWIKK